MSMKAMEFMSFSLFAISLVANTFAFADTTFVADKALGQPLPGGIELRADYIALPLLYPPAERLRQNLEKELSAALLNRGEAHITVVTPPELKVLAKILS